MHLQLSWIVVSQTCLFIFLIRFPFLLMEPDCTGNSLSNSRIVYFTLDSSFEEYQRTLGVCTHVCSCGSELDLCGICYEPQPLCLRCQHKFAPHESNFLLKACELCPFLACYRCWSETFKLQEQCPQCRSIILMFDGRPVCPTDNSLADGKFIFDFFTHLF
jgi:hypothetical protein